LPPGRFAIQFARLYRGDKVATVAGSNVVCGPIEAALANGMLAHSDETDDTHPPSQSHPGCSIVPAALAAGEKFGADGTRFVRAVALGYDVGQAAIHGPEPSQHAFPLGFVRIGGCRRMRRRFESATDALAALVYGAA